MIDQSKDPDDRIIFEMQPEMLKEIEQLTKGTSKTTAEVLRSAFSLLKKQTHNHVELERAVTLPYSKRKPEVFICHAKEDRDVAQEIFVAMRRRGIDPWFDEENLEPGEVWRDVIQKVISRTDAILVLLSKQSVSKKDTCRKKSRPHSKSRS